MHILYRQGDKQQVIIHKLKECPFPSLIKTALFKSRQSRIKCKNQIYLHYAFFALYASFLQYVTKAGFYKKALWFFSVCASRNIYLTCHISLPKSEKLLFRMNLSIFQNDLLLSSSTTYNSCCIVRKF